MENIYKNREYLIKDRTYGSNLHNFFIRKLLISDNAAPKNQTLGCDVSHWNGFSDFHKMKSRGMQFGISKGADVGSASKKPFVDQRAEYNQIGIKNAGMLAGGYCWLDPHPYTTPEEQANFYLDEFYFKYETQIPPSLDFEDRNVISWGDMLWRAQVWLEVVEKRTGKIPIVYTSPGYMSNFDKKKSSFLARYPLWIAHYIQRTYPTIPYPWTEYTIWQYSDRGHYPYYIYNSNTMHGREWGSDSSYLDMNWFNGTYQDLLKFCKTQELPKPEPPDETPSDDILFKVKCIAYLLNVRSGPSTRYSIVSTIGANSVHNVYEEKYGWYRIGEDKWISGTYAKKLEGEDEISPLFKAKCIVTALNVRSGPSTLYGILGQIKKDDVVSVYEVKNSWYRVQARGELWVSGYPTYMKRI